MNICAKYEALLDLYVDGELAAEDMICVQDHLDSCPACRAYVDDALAIRAAFPDEESAALPEGFHEAVMARVAREAAPKKKKSRAWVALPTMAAACLALVAAVGGLPGTGMKQEAATAQYSYGVPAADAPAASIRTTAEAAPEEPATENTAAAAAADTEGALYSDSADITEELEKGAYFTTLTLTAEEAGSLLANYEAMPWEDGATAYELTAEEYGLLISALEQDGSNALPGSIAEAAPKGLALVIIQD